MTVPARRQDGRRGSSPATILHAVIVASALVLTITGCASSADGTAGAYGAGAAPAPRPQTPPADTPSTETTPPPRQPGTLERTTAPIPETTDASAAQSQAADPRRIRIPAIGVSSAVIPLRLDGNRKLIAPERFDLTGWNRAGPEPGESGAAVIAGHVDSYRGPAVFFDLRDLSSGDEVHVDRADGSTVTFVVDHLERHPKTGVPDSVYAPTPNPQLRLITCGGDFDPSHRSYVDNIVVYASMA